jgi:hypothetical protein
VKTNDSIALRSGPRLSVRPTLPLLRLEELLAFGSADAFQEEQFRIWMGLSQR